MKFFSHVILLLAPVLCGCGSTSMGDSIEEARRALERDDYDSAKSICDELRKHKADSVNGDVNVLCDLSIFYMRLADTAERDDNIDVAKQCYVGALSVDSVAAREYYSRLGVDDMAYGALLESMVITAGRDNGSAMADSVVIACDSMTLDYN